MHIILQNHNSHFVNKTFDEHHMAAFDTVFIVAVWRLDEAALLDIYMFCFRLLTIMSPIGT